MNHCGTIEIKTDRLILRQFKHSDYSDMLEYWVSDPNVQSMYSEPIYTTKAEVDELLEKYIGSYEKQDYYRWAVIESESQKCIGQIAIFLVDNKNHFCEIEYCIGGNFQRKGYATEATKSIINFALNKVDFHKVQICHKENNIASKGVIKNCGFVYEGTLRDYFFMNGKYVSRLYYSIIKDEFNNK